MQKFYILSYDSLWIAIQHFFVERMQPRYLRLVSLATISIYICLLLLTFATQQNGKTIFGPLLGADFSAFYNAGRIFHEQMPARVYVALVQAVNFHQLFPTMPMGLFMPYANAPFLTPLFSLLAYLPYSVAYLVWLGLGLGLYILGFTLLWQSLEQLRRINGRLALLLALSFTPFLMEAWIGGQTSTIGFFCLALAIVLERRGWPISSGVVVSLCWYKLPLLLLIGPMLLLTGRLRALLGFIIGTTGLAALSYAWFGYIGLLNYVDMLLSFGRAAAVPEVTARLWKFIDINAFSHLLLPAHPLIGNFIAASVLLVGLYQLIGLWRRIPLQDIDGQAALWGITITATVVFNGYSGFYEATLVVLSVMLCCHAYAQNMNSAARPLAASLRVMFAFLYVFPWFSQPVARVTGIQLFTLVLLAFVIYQWRWLCKRYRNNEP